MTNAASTSKPIYKRLGFWLLLAFTLCALFAASAPKTPEGKPSPDGALATVLAMLLLIALMVNHLYRKWASRRQAKARKASAAAADAAAQAAALDHIITNGISPITTDRLLPRNDEKAYFSAPGVLYETKTVSIRHGGVSARVRVANGVSVSMGGGRSTPESKMVAVAQGELIATNIRVVFAGSGKSFDTPISKIINVEYFDDGVLINVSNRQTSLFVGLTRHNVTLFQEVFKQILDQQVA